MDEIAASLGISKRTLYEVFPDKETLLEECILKSQKDGDIFVKGVIETSSNVLEVLLRCYQWSIERFHATNKKFFEDIKKYPKAYQLMKNNRNRSSEDTVNFFKEGVKQGKLQYAFYVFRHKKSKTYRYIFFRNNKPEQDAVTDVTLVYMEGKATLGELKQMFK